MFFIPSRPNQPMSQEQFNYYCQTLPIRTYYYDENGSKKYKLLNTIYYNPKEQFKIYPNNPNVAVGDYGTIIDLINQCKLSGTNCSEQERNAIENDYYIRVFVQSSENNNPRQQAHRMVLETFLPNENSQNLYVNHINGIKQDNRLENLEWCTASENTHHAMRMNLMYYVYTEEQVHQICRFMEQGYQNPEIYEIMGYPGPNKYQFLRFCHNLRNHSDTTWAHVTCQYNIPPADVTRHSEEEIIMICELIIQGLSDKEIKDICMRDFGHTKYSEGYIRIIRYCNPKYQPELWEIVKDYKDKFPDRTKRNFTDEQIDIMFEYLNIHAKPPVIAEALGIPDDRKLRITLSQIRQGKIKPEKLKDYPNITKENRRTLTEEEADRIWILKKQGLTARQISEAIGLEWKYSFPTTVNQIMKGETFPNIKEKHKND